MKMDEYIIPENLDDAYKLLCENKKNFILAGGTGIQWVSHIHKGIEVCGILSHEMKKENEIVSIGAMTSFREMERASLTCFGPVTGENFKRCLRETGGIQLRNQLTAGGAICTPMWRMDFIVFLSAFEADLIFYKAGRISFSDYLRNGAGISGKDILVKIEIKDPEKWIIADHIKNSELEEPVLSAAASFENNRWKIWIGGSGHYPVRAVKAEEIVNKETEQVQGKLPEDKKEQIFRQLDGLQEEIDFKDSIRSSSDYCRQIQGKLIGSLLEEFI